jgi:hypothetical protein
MAYARAARAVRLAVLLQDQLAPGGGEDPKEAARQAEAVHRKAQVERTVRIVKRVARDHCGKEGFALGAYVGEAKERLDNDDIYGLVASRPLGELVAMICEDLGLQPSWDDLAAEAWAQAEIEGGAKGSPFLEDDDEDMEAGESEAGPARADWRPPTFEEALLERVPAAAAVVAAARRDSG